MTIDTFTTMALAKELNQHLVGGRIQDSVEIERDTFGFEIYANQERHYLLLSASQQHPRALITTEKLRRGVQTASPLGLLLRRRVEGMRVMRVTQPPWERILIFDVANEDEQLQVIIELIARRANLLLVEDGIILDCARRVGPQENRYRVTLPRHEYIPPPPLESKLDPSKLTPHTLESLFRRNANKQLWSVLVQELLGFSPLFAKEVVYRAYKRLDILAGKANPFQLYAAMESFMPRLLRRGDWEPGLMTDEFGTAQAVSVLPITHAGKWEPSATVSAAIDAFMGRLEGPSVYEAARKPIREQIENARSRLQRKIKALEKELMDLSEVNFLRQAGELILAYQYMMTPKQQTLIAQYEVEGEPLTINLNPDLTALENAQSYFERYEKKKRAHERLPSRIEDTQNELGYLDQLDTDLSLAENWEDIGEVQDTLQKNGYWRGKHYTQPKGGKSAPHRVSVQGIVILVGRNARQNEQLLHDSEPYDLWLHAREAPGSHVIIKTQAKPMPPHVVEQAAAYAAYYSKKRNDGKVLVMVAERRHVRKIKGGKPGQVRVHQELPSLVVQPKPVETKQPKVEAIEDLDEFL